MLPVIRAAAVWMDRIPSKVSIPGGRLNLGMAQQLADHHEALAQGQCPRSIRMPEVVNSPILQAGAPMDAPPGLLKVGRC